MKWRNAETKPGFVELSVPLPLRYAGEEIVVEKGEVKIRIPLTVGREELRAVMEGLGSVL